MGFWYPLKTNVGSCVYFLETLEQNAHPTKKNIEKWIAYKQVIEFKFEPLAN